MFNQDSVRLIGRSVITSSSLNQDELSCLFAYTDFFKNCKGIYPQNLKSLILLSLFFEPSTRTRLSFESAMIRLGGQVLTLESGGVSSSISKGESLSDMGKVTSQYGDCSVFRHFQPGSSEAFSSQSSIPVINAGDGEHEHPTQAFIDLYSIISTKGDPNKLTIGFFGDVEQARTMHSLISLLSHYETRIIVINQESSILLPNKLSNKLLFEKNLETVIDQLDVLYVTRFQKERYPKAIQKHTPLIISKKLLNKGKADLLLLHPLPRLSEIPHDIDTCPQAYYFTQAQNGLYLRMALLSLILDRVDSSWI